MGCDIHMWMETRRWGDQPWEVVLGEDACYDVRNYTLFSWLADVRNYDERVTPLSSPRGLPPDISAELSARITDDPDLHSRSYFLVSEILTAAHKPDGVQDFVEWLSALVSRDAKGKWRTALQMTPHDRMRIVFAFDN